MKHFLITTIAVTSLLAATGFAGPIHDAARKGDIEAVKQHLAAGRNVNAKDDKGRTPLHRAAREGHKEVAELLIAAGAALNSKDKEGKTPLYHAARWGHTNIAALLIAAGADVIDVGGESEIPARRLVSKHSVSGIQQVSYYWFTGAKVITPSHYRRTLTDIWDRLTTGTNQRWAYVTVSSPLNGEHPLATHSEKETNAMITELIAKLFRKIHKVDQLGDDWKLVGP